MEDMHMEENKIKIRITCPNCQKSLKASATMLGRKVRCPACNTTISIPKDTFTSPPLPPLPKKPVPLSIEQPQVEAVKAAEEKGDGFIWQMASMEEDKTDFTAAAKSAMEELQRFDYSLLSPVLRAFSPRLLRRKAVRWLIGFGLFPLLIMYLAEMYQWGFDDTAWFLGAYFCFFWIVFFNDLMTPDTSIKRKGIKWAFFYYDCRNPPSSYLARGSDY